MHWKAVKSDSSFEKCYAYENKCYGKYRNVIEIELYKDETKVFCIQ